MMPIRYALILPLIALTACSKPPATMSLPQYVGQTQSAVITELGKPARREHFLMRDAAGEFRIQLRNTYPLSNPANANVQIEEFWWDDGDDWITLWFHQVNSQWVVLDALRWRKDVQF